MILIDVETGNKQNRNFRSQSMNGEFTWIADEPKNHQIGFLQQLMGLDAWTHSQILDEGREPKLEISSNPFVRALEGPHKSTEEL